MPSVESGQIKFVFAEVFRDGIKPEWEDKMNQNGGHFQFQLKNSITPGQIDESPGLASAAARKMLIFRIINRFAKASEKQL